MSQLSQEDSNLEVDSLTVYYSVFSKQSNIYFNGYINKNPSPILVQILKSAKASSKVQQFLEEIYTASNFGGLNYKQQKTIDNKTTV